MRAGHTLIITVWVLVLAAGLVLVEQIVPEPAATPGVVADAEEQRSGLAACAVGDGREGTGLTVLAAHADPAATSPSRVRYRTVDDGTSSGESEVTVAPGQARPLDDVDGEGAAVTARWHDEPAVLARSWELTEDSEDEFPPGIVQGPCPTRPSDHWVIPGLRTEGGAEARLRLANPYESDATVAVRFLTPEEAISPTILQNVTVPARGTVEINANDHVPERLDLGAEVTVASGRVFAEGYQMMRSEIGGIDGASLLAAAGEPAETWTIPWLRATGAEASWLWLYNPAERPAAVELTLHTDDGGVVPEGLGEVTVSPGQLRRVDLSGTFPEDVGTAAVTLRSPGVGIFASGAVEQAPDEVADTGLAVQLGATALDDRWVVAGGPHEEGRRADLHLVNPGSEPAVVDVQLWNGSETVTPEGFEGIEVPPGSRRGLELTDHLGEEPWTAFVTATEGALVVGHTGAGGGEAARLVAGTGAAVGQLASPVSPVPLVHEPGLAQRLGTSLGVRPRGPGAAVEEEDEPEPEPRLVPSPTPTTPEPSPTPTAPAPSPTP